MTPEQTRDLSARLVVFKRMIRDHGDRLSDSAANMLLEAAMASQAYKAHISGSEKLAVGEVLQAAYESEIGRIIMDSVRPKEDAPKGILTAAELASMTPEERINWARKKHGVGAK